MMMMMVAEKQLFMLNNTIKRSHERIRSQQQIASSLLSSMRMKKLPWRSRSFITTTTNNNYGGKKNETKQHLKINNDSVESNNNSVLEEQQQQQRFFTSSSKEKGNRRRKLQFVEDYFNDTLDARELHKNIKDRAWNIKEYLQETRRTLHRHPELMYEEKETSAYLQNELQQMNISSFTTGWGIDIHSERRRGGYGIVADIGTGKDPCVLLRADMDALPIIEETEGIDDFRSQNEGKMHACGHDGHTAMLLGAASVLKEMEDSLNGTVRLMFQPAEEGGAGAKRMREEGVLDMEPKPQQAFGLHVWPTLPSGSIASRPGPLLAACDRFEISITGVGGHAAMPHLTVDPIVAASAIIMNLQTIVSRKLDPLRESGVCSITTIHAGSDVFNVIPTSTTMRGTVRALSTETLLSLRERVEHIVRTTATTHGCDVSLLRWSPDYYPPTINDPTLFENFSKDVAAVVSEEGYVRDDIEPTMGSEDFSFVSERIPSTFFLLGQGSGTDPPTNYGLHHPNFALDESVLPRGVELHVNLALQALKRIEKSQ